MELKCGKRKENNNKKKTKNIEYNDLRKNICLRKSDVSVSVCNAMENLAEKAYTVCHDPIPMMPLLCYCNNYDVILMSK